VRAGRRSLAMVGIRQICRYDAHFGALNSPLICVTEWSESVDAGRALEPSIGCLLPLTTFDGDGRPRTLLLNRHIFDPALAHAPDRPMSNNTYGRSSRGCRRTPTTDQSAPVEPWRPKYGRSAIWTALLDR
jgi:hypothetical protein